METKLPYVNQPGSMVRILEKVKEAKTPDRFTGDFLATKLGFRGGTSRQFIPLAKKLALLNSDGTPTDLYKQFRNAATSRTAMAQATKAGYRELFDRNEYANNLTKEQIKGLVVEITGLDAKNRVVQLVCQTFEAMKKLGDFDAPVPKTSLQHEMIAPKPETTSIQDQNAADLSLGLSYTINLVLPKTDDPAVFNAIFSALREHLLRK